MEAAPSFDHMPLLFPAADTALPCSCTANLKEPLKELQLPTADPAAKLTQESCFGKAY